MNLKNAFLLSVCGTTLFLNGCTSITPSSSNETLLASAMATSAATPRLTWPEREQALQKITAWQLNGVIGIQHATKSDSASVNWQQNDATHYNLRLFGPFGAGAANVVGEPGRVSLTSNSQPKPVIANNAENLIAEQTGWNLPVSQLFYWIKGLPAPGGASQKSLDDQNRLSSLQQAGWQIQYTEYSDISGVALPTKMLLTKGKFRIKLVIKSWRV